MYNEIISCRICKGNIVDIFDLGYQALSGRFADSTEDKIPEIPLVLSKCVGSCGLVQLKHTVSGSELYGHYYGYMSGVNTTMRNHLQGIIKMVEDMIDISPGEYVLDIGSNDATTLKLYSRPGIKKIGMDPTGMQFSEYYKESGIILIPDFFSTENVLKVTPKIKLPPPGASILKNDPGSHPLWVTSET